MDACAVGNVLKSLLLPPKGEAGRANRGLLYMRCLACGAEMRLIQAAPDETTMFAGYEQYTFECSGCRLQARRLVSHHEIGPFAEERMRLPPGWLRTRNMGVSAPVAWAHALSNLYGWTVESFSSWRHRAVSILVVGIIITAALAGSLLTWDGAKGPAGDQGPAGPKGPTGDPGPPGQESGQASSLRIVQSNCDQTSCTAQCGENEILLTAYCGPKRNAALIPTDRTATCRTRVPANSPLVAVCAAVPSP
jgi:hypothetical protein